MAVGQLFVYLVQLVKLSAVAIRCYVRTQGNIEIRNRMVMLQLWTRNLKYAHFGKTRQCLIQVSESQWCSSIHLALLQGTLRLHGWCNMMAFL